MCVCVILNMVVCIHTVCMWVCPASACAQYISFTVTNCGAWVLWGNPRLLWMTHEKALIFQRRDRTKRRRRIGTWGCRARRAEICLNSMSLPSHFQSWLRQITLSFLCWHIWDGFISFCWWMGVLCRPLKSHRNRDVINSMTLLTVLLGLNYKS